MPFFAQIELHGYTEGFECVFPDSKIKTIAPAIKTGAAAVGLAFSEDDWEYPLHVLIGQESPAVQKIAHVLVENRSKTLGDPLFRPDLIVSSRGRPVETLGVESYATVGEFGVLRILAPEGDLTHQ